jgi:hypothetical protein
MPIADAMNLPFHRQLIRYVVTVVFLSTIWFATKDNKQGFKKKKKVMNVLLWPLRLLDMQNWWYLSPPRHHQPLQHMEVKCPILPISISQAVVHCAQICNEQRA